MNTNKIERNVIKFFSSNKSVQIYGQPNLQIYEKKILKKILFSNSRILDVGCGGGRVAIPLAKMGYFVVGVDINPTLIKIARKNAKIEKLTNIKFYLKDIVKFKFKKEFFDFAIIFENSLEHIPSNKKREKALLIINNLLKPEGLLIISFNSYFYPFKRFVKLQFQNIKNLIFKKYEINDTIFHGLYHHMFTHFEIEKLFRKTGFKKVQIIPINLLDKKMNMFKSLKLYETLRIFLYNFWIFKKFEQNKE